MQGCDYQSIVQATDKIFHCPSILHTCQCSRRSALLLRPGRNHAVAARVRDRLPQMLVLIFDNQHQRALLRHVSSEQFHRRLQVVVGKSRNRFLQTDVRAFKASCIFSGSVMGAAFAPVFGVPESTPASMPFSVTIRLNTSPTERTPWPGFQSYLPDITRASPVNLSESVPASFPKAAGNPAACACANGAIRATASAHTTY